MAKTIEKLKPLDIKRLAKKGMYPDGNGLYLQVSLSGSKSWILRYTIAGKTRYHGLGSFATFTLSEARIRATEKRQLLTDGKDPIDEKKTATRNNAARKANTITFDKAAADYIEANRSGWRNSKHEDQWVSTLSTYASPVIGDLPVSDITPDLVLQILQPIWDSKTETAVRVRGRIENVLDWAKVKGYRTGDNPAAWRGHLAHALPKPSKVAKAGHHSALPWLEIKDFMSSLRNMEGFGAIAMQLIILTATRTSEVLKAVWTEFDLKERTWLIPAHRMKGNRDHKVPLSDSALAILETMKLKANPDNDFVFAGRKSGAISNMACLQTLKRMNRSDITVHGFRSTFRDWCSETTNYPKDVYEMALAHAIENKTEAAYRRGDLLDKRANLMQEWADYCKP